MHVADETSWGCMIYLSMMAKIKTIKKYLLSLVNQKNGIIAGKALEWVGLIEYEGHGELMQGSSVNYKVAC